MSEDITSWCTKVLTWFIILQQGELEDRLHELQYSKEQLELVNSNLSNRVSRLEEEREDKEKDVASYCNALEVMYIACCCKV